MGYFLNLFFTGLPACCRQAPFDLGQAADLPAAGRCHDVAGNDAGKRVSDGESWPAGHTGSHLKATTCVYGRPKP